MNSSGKLTPKVFGYVISLKESYQDFLEQAHRLVYSCQMNSLDSFEIGDHVIATGSDGRTIKGYISSIDANYPGKVSVHETGTTTYWWLDEQDLILDLETMFPSGHLGDSLDYPVSLPRHDGHEVVDNQVMGKAFRYCRDCKEEV